MDFMASVLKKIIPSQNDSKPHSNNKTAAAAPDEREKKEHYIPKLRRSVLKEFDPFVSDSPCPPRNLPQTPIVKEDEHFEDAEPLFKLNGTLIKSEVDGLGSCKALNSLNQSATNLLIPGLQAFVDPLKLGRTSPNPADTSDIEYVEAFESLSSQPEEPKSLSSEEDIIIKISHSAQIIEDVEGNVSDAPGNPTLNIVNEESIVTKVGQHNVDHSLNASKDMLDKTLGISSAFEKLNIMDVSKTNVSEVSFKDYINSNDSLTLESEENSSKTNNKSVTNEPFENTCEKNDKNVEKNVEKNTVEIRLLNTTNIKANVEENCHDLGENVIEILNVTDSLENISAIGSPNSKETFVNTKANCQNMGENVSQNLNISENILNNTDGLVQTGVLNTTSTFEQSYQTSNAETITLNVTENEINKTMDMTQSATLNVGQTKNNIEETNTKSKGVNLTQGPENDNIADNKVNTQIIEKNNEPELQITTCLNVTFTENENLDNSNRNSYTTQNVDTKIMNQSNNKQEKLLDLTKNLGECNSLNGTSDMETFENHFEDANSENNVTKENKTVNEVSIYDSHDFVSLESKEKNSNIDNKVDKNETLDITNKNVCVNIENRRDQVVPENILNHTVDVEENGLLNRTETIGNNEEKDQNLDKNVEDVSQIGSLNTTKIHENYKQNLSDIVPNNFNVSNEPTDTTEASIENCQNSSHAETRSLNVTQNTENEINKTIDMNNIQESKYLDVTQNAENDLKVPVDIIDDKTNTQLVREDQSTTSDTDFRKSLNATPNVECPDLDSNIENEINKTIDTTRHGSLNVTMDNIDIIDTKSKHLNVTQNGENNLNTIVDIIEDKTNTQLPCEDQFQDVNSENSDVTNTTKSDGDFRKSLDPTLNAECPGLSSKKLLNETNDVGTHNLDNSDTVSRKSLNATSHVESPAIKTNKVLKDIDVMVDSLEGPILDKKSLSESMNAQTPENSSEKIMIAPEIVDQKVKIMKDTQNDSPKFNLKSKSHLKQNTIHINVGFDQIKSEAVDEHENCQNKENLGHLNVGFDKTKPDVIHDHETCLKKENVVTVADPEMAKKVENLEHKLHAQNMQFAEKYRSDVEKYQVVLGQYERQITKQAGDLEHLRQENGTMAKHFSNLELAFSDVFQKYEKTKNIVQQFKENENHLASVASSMEEAVKQSEDKYQQAKKWFDQQVQEMNKKVIRTKEKYDHEICSLKTKVKRYEIKCLSLETALKQKTEECQQLAALCDDITCQ